MDIDDGRVVTNFINQALYNKNITIYGDGTQTRSFQFIDDLIEAMIRVMKTDKTFHGPIISIPLNTLIWEIQMNLLLEN